jgi:hypothetical protein
MKKNILLVFVLIFSVVNVVAQKYEKSIEIGAAFCNYGIENNYFDVLMINGLRLKNTVYIGIGAGLSFGDVECYRASIGDEISYGRMSKVTLPVFARLKINLTNDTKISPFLMANIGYNIDPSPSTSSQNGVLIEPNLGIDINVSNDMVLYGMIGLHIGHAECTNIGDFANSYGALESDLTSGFSIRGGIKF